MASVRRFITRREPRLGSTEPAWLAPLSQPTWERLTHASLAERIEGHAAFVAAFTTDSPPRIRASILRPSRMRPAPLGLDGIALPPLPDSQALAQWLDISPDDLDWFSAGPQRRSRARSSRRSATRPAWRATSPRCAP